MTACLKLALILLFRSLPNDDIKLRELLERFGLIERFTPYGEFRDKIVKLHEVKRFGVDGKPARW